MAGEFADNSIQPDDALADARRMGLGDEEIADLREALGRQEGRKLWAMHLDAFRALCAAGTQWRSRIAATEKGFVDLVTGLDYAGLKVALEMLGLALSPGSWAQLMVLEAAAAGAMNGEPAPPEVLS